MQDLNEMGVFATVAEQGSFTKAANKLGMPKSSVSRHVSQLEERLGERLLNRTTRQMKLTEVGKLYFQHCRRIVEEAESARSVVSSMKAQPTGHLRVSAPLAFGSPFLQDVVHEFLQKNKKLSLELVLENRLVDLVDEEIDLAVRLGPLDDSSLVARTMGASVLTICATPAYLEEHGEPKTPQDLANFNLIKHPGAELNFKCGTEIEMNNRFMVNDMGVVKEMALRGFGLGVVPLMLAAEEVADGRLIPLLVDYPMEEKDFFLVYPSRRQLASKTLAFINFITEKMSEQMQWNLSVQEYLEQVK